MDDFFVGHKLHKIDNKGRISIPANMRSALGNEFVVSRGIGNCITLFPIEEWKLFLEKIRAVSQSERKRLEFFFLASAEKMSLDGQGRLMLGEDLRRHAGLLNDDKAEVFGNNNRVEIWNSDVFNQQFNSFDMADIESILDKNNI